MTRVFEGFVTLICGQGDVRMLFFSKFAENQEIVDLFCSLSSPKKSKLDRLGVYRV